MSGLARTGVSSPLKWQGLKPLYAIFHDIYIFNTSCNSQKGMYASCVITACSSSICSKAGSQHF